MADYRQLRSDELRWPSGSYRSAALLDLPPQALDASRGLTFYAGSDDLDYFRAAAVALPSGRRVALWWYERAPEPRGLELRIDAADDPAAARAEAFAALQLPHDAIVWVPDAATAELTNLSRGPQRWEGQIFVVLRRDPAARAPSDLAAVEAFWREEDARETVALAQAVTRDATTQYSYTSVNLFRTESSPKSAEDRSRPAG